LVACLECGRVVDEKAQGNRSQLLGAGVGGVAVVVGLTRLRSCSRSERLACSSFASRCGFGLFGCYQGTLFQGGLGLVLVLVWMSPGNNVPRVQGNLNPFGCTLHRNRVLEDRRTCLSSTGLVDLDLCLALKKALKPKIA
jgi:hypothetical protein